MKNTKKSARLSPSEVDTARPILARHLLKSYRNHPDVLRGIPNSVIQRTGERLSREVEGDDDETRQQEACYEIHSAKAQPAALLLHLQSAGVRLPASRA